MWWECRKMSVENDRANCGWWMVMDKDLPAEHPLLRLQVVFTRDSAQPWVVTLCPGAGSVCCVLSIWVVNHWAVRCPSTQQWGVPAVPSGPVSISPLSSGSISAQFSPPVHSRPTLTGLQTAKVDIIDIFGGRGGRVYFYFQDYHWQTLYLYSYIAPALKNVIISILDQQIWNFTFYSLCKVKQNS